MSEPFNVNFNANLKLFLRLSNCASVSEKTLIIIKMHGIYVKNFISYSIFGSELQPRISDNINTLSISTAYSIKLPSQNSSGSRLAYSVQL
jgi:hypothetical protein